MDNSPSRRVLALAVAGALALPLVLGSPPEGLSNRGAASVGIYAACAVLWVSHALPVTVTSLLALVGLAGAGVIDSREAFGFFGSDAVFFVLCAFMLYCPFVRSGLAERLVLAVVDRFQGPPRRLATGILLASSVLSLCLSGGLAAVVVFPLVARIVVSLALPARSRLGKALFLGMSWGCVVGGSATLLGGVRGPLALGILQSATGSGFTFVTWALAALPVVGALLVACAILLPALFRVEIEHAGHARDALREARRKGAPMSGRDRLLGTVLLATLVLWAGFDRMVGLAPIGIGAVVVLFVLRLARWEEIEEDVNWGVVLMYGGAICLATAMSRSGASAWLVTPFVHAWEPSPIAVVALLSLLSLVLTEFVPNAAVVAVLAPFALGFAEILGMSAAPLVLAVAIPSGLGFALPRETPAAAIGFSSSFLEGRDALRGGLVLKATSWVAVCLAARFVWPTIGLSLERVHP